MAGCDYLPNIPGFGIKKAMKMLKHLTLSETLNRLRYNKQYINKIPAGYMENIKKVKYQFLYGRVIDMETYQMTTLRPLPEEVKEQDIEGIGHIFEKEIVEKYAKGLFNYKKKQDVSRRSREEAIEILRDATGYNKKPKEAKEVPKEHNIEKEDIKEQNTDKKEVNDVSELKEDEEVKDEIEKLNKEEENLYAKKRLYFDLVQDESEEPSMEPPTKIKKTES